MPNNVVFSNPGASLVQWGDGAATPYLTLSSVPTSGTVGVAVTGLVTNPGAVSAPWAVATSPADTIVSPSSGTLSPGAAVAFTLTALASGLKNVQLTSTAPDCVISGSPASFTAASVAPPPPPPAPAASSLALSVASTGTTGSATLVTVTPNAAIGASGTATLSVSGGGTLGSSTLNFTAGSSASQSTTLTRATDGTTVLTLTNNMGLANTGTPASYTSTTSASTGTPQPFTLTSSSSGTLPFAIGYAMAQGHVPSGSSLSFSGATAKLTILATWPDGSAKHGIIAGTYASGGTAATVTPTVAGVAAGTLLTGAAVQTAMGANTAAFDAGAFGTATFSGADFASPFVTHAATDSFIEAIYRKQIGGDSHLVAWLSLRVWSSGAVEVLPWIENGYLTVASPTNKSATYSFTLGGTSRFSALIDIKHHTRVPLLSGSTFAYWLGADPAVTPQHSTDYLQSTKLVPTYGYGTPSTATLNALQQTYTANTLAGVNPAMGAAGGSAALISNPQALYISSGGDARAYRSAIVFGLSGGSWSVHYRDELTNLPLDLPDYPSITLQGGTPAIPAAGGSTNGTASVTHQPSFGYLPYLLTGRFWFLEESQFWCGYNFLSADTDSRRGRTEYFTGPYLFADASAGIIDPRAGTYANRGAHWSVRTLAQTLAITPSTHPNAAGYQAVWENNTTFYNATFVTGTHAPGWVSPQGFLGDYSSSGDSLYGLPGGVNSWFGAGWMSTFGVQAWGFASNLGLAQSSASAARTNAIRDQAYKQVTTRAGDGTAYNWRRFIVYAYPVGADGTGMPYDSMRTGAQSYADLLSAYSLASIPATEGLSLKNHSADTDLVNGSSVDYGSFGLSALAYAVDHGAPGAADGWLRVTGASNFNVFDVLADSPEHGIIPRNDPALPAWVPVAGSGVATNINLNTLTSVDDCPAGNCYWSGSGKQAAPWRNWNGGVHAFDDGQYGSQLFWGGGHGGGENIGIWKFDLNTRMWSRLGPDNPPSPPQATNSGAPYYLDPTWIDYDYQGSKATLAAHTYNYPVYVPASVSGGGTKGQWLIPQLILGALPNGGSPGAHPHAVDVATGVWTRYTTNIGATANGETYSGTLYDSTRKVLWWAAMGALSFNKIDLTQAHPRAITQYTPPYGEWGFGLFYGNWVYVPEADFALCFGCLYQQTAVKAAGYSLSTGVPLQSFNFNQTPWALQDVVGAGFGVDWCPITQAFYLYEGKGATRVLKLKPASLNFASTTWTWSTETFSNPAWTPADGTSRDGAQPMTKWKYVPALRSFTWSDGPGTSGVCVDGVTRTGLYQLWRPLGA